MQGLPDINGLSATNWLLEMEGPRAFVNQTDVRVAIAEDQHHEGVLQMKWSRRVHGDSPLMLLERVFDESGDAAGYRHMTGAALLSPERRAALEKLPRDFSFREAKFALGRSDDPTNKFLRECIHLGVVEKLERGKYRKLTTVTTNEPYATGEGMEVGVIA